MSNESKMSRDDTQDFNKVDEALEKWVNEVVVDVPMSMIFQVLIFRGYCLGMALGETNESLQNLGHQLIDHAEIQCTKIAEVVEKESKIKKVEK